MESGTVFLQKIRCALLYMVGALVLFVGWFLFFCLGLVCLGFFFFVGLGFFGGLCVCFQLKGTVEE